MSECEAVKRNGRVCGAHALRGEQYCYMHSPTRAGERAAARRRGGQARGSHAGSTESLPERMRSIEDALLLLDYTRDEIIALDNGVQRNRALIALAGEVIRAIELSEFEQRLSALEEKANNAKKR